MPQKISPFLEVKYGWDVGEGGWNVGMDENLVKFSFLLTASVDGIVNTLPSNPVDGQSYFLTTDNRFYARLSSTWQSIPCPKDFVFIVKSTGENYQFDGFSANPVQSLAALESTITTIQNDLNTLGTAAYQDIDYFVDQSSLDILESQLTSYTDDSVLPLSLKIGRVLTPEQYGAVGDGVANDTAAWVAAAAALQPGDTLRASGEYLIHGSDVVVSGVNGFVLDLQGARFRQQTNNSKTLRIEACTKFSVKGGEFYGRGGAAGEFIPASTSYNGVAGIFISQCDYVQIYGNRLFDHAGGSIVWRESDHLFIHDNLVEGIGSTYIAAGDNGQDFAIGGFSDDIARMDFVANISNNEIRGTAFGIFHNRCKSLIISGNTIDGIPGQHGIYTIECSGMTVTGNTFRNVNNHACKMQLENYAGRGLAPVGALNHTGIVFSGNTVDDCGDGFAVISTSLSDGTDQKVFGVEVVGNTINNVTQDGLILNHCIDAQVGPNSINGTGRFGISFRNSSGSLFGNTIKESGASGISASQFDDVDYINNTLIDCGLNNLAGVGNDVPILITNTASPLPSQVVTPKAFFRNNRIQFTAGDAASTNLIFTSTRDLVHIEGTRTNSLKTVRVDGTLLFCESNDFIGFASGAQNSPTTFLPGHGRREYHGQQNPQAAGSTAAFQRGDICWNTNVLATGAVFWVCTASGSPGTWAVGATR